MLCSRSASLVATTRASADIIVVITWVTWVTWHRGRLPRRSSAMCPVIIVAISVPKSRLNAASAYGVSWTVSCKIAAHSVRSSTSPASPRRARIVATATGWVLYGSPL
jgi:hypothetical protein